MASVSVQVEVDLSEIELSDLEQELRNRNSSHTFSGLCDDDIEALAEKYRYALYSGNKEELIKAASEYFEAAHDIRNLRI